MAIIGCCDMCLKKGMRVKMNQNKNLQYYLDSRIYSSEEVQKSIEETKKEFPNKNVKVSVALNNFGMYIITFEFENKNTFFNRIKIKLWKRFKKTLLLDSGNKNRLEQYSGERRYGQYKDTKTYRPY